MAQDIPPGQATPTAPQDQAPAQSVLPQLRGPSQPAASPQQTPQSAPQPAPQQAPQSVAPPGASPIVPPAGPPAVQQQASQQRTPSQPPAPQQRIPSQPPLPPQQPHPAQQQSPSAQYFQNGHAHQLQQPIPQRALGRPPDPVMVHRAPIINPPLQGIPQPPPQLRETAIVDPRGGIMHPSPKRMYHQENPKVWDDYMRLTFAIEQGLSDSVRLAVRQNWEKCLLGTNFHQGFMLNAILDTVPADVARGSMKDFGVKLVKNTKAEIVSHMNTADIDEIASQILALASDRFLDAALEMRLHTIDAKPLINALARAERLGYEPGDIVEEPVDGQERVIPQDVPQDIPQGMQQPPPPPAAALPLQRQCQMCSRLFADEPPYIYHVANKVCMLRPESKDGFPFSCGNCGQGFENTYGVEYHDSTHACRKYNSPKLVPPAPPAPTAATAPFARPRPMAAPQTPQSASQGSPVAPRPAVIPTPPRPSQSGSANNSPAADPYAHLSEEQLDALNAELVKCEEMYTERFREVEEIVDPIQRRTRLDNLKNSFGTRQSNIRRKYGVRLRERRTKAELKLERERMGMAGYTSLYSTRGKRASGDLYPTTTTPTSSQGDGAASYAVKRARVEGDTPAGSRSGSLSQGTPETTDQGRVTVTSGASVPMTETPRAVRLPPPPANDDDDNISDSSSDNDDIPARLPDSVRQSFSLSQH